MRVWVGDWSPFRSGFEVGRVFVGKGRTSVEPFDLAQRWACQCAARRAQAGGTHRYAMGPLTACYV